MEERKANGQFSKGVSGNPNGRPRRREPDHSLPAANRRAIFEIANTPVEVTIRGKKVTKTLYEATMLHLGKAAAHGDLQAGKLFARYVHDAAREDLTMRLSNLRHREYVEGLETELDELRRRSGRHGVVVVPLAVAEDARLDDGRTDLDELYGESKG